jgi:hypothetical protein
MKELEGKHQREHLALVKRYDELEKSNRDMLEVKCRLEGREKEQLQRIAGKIEYVN